MLLLGAIDECVGHGWVTNPPSRNNQAGPKNGYCPHCGNGNGICGDGNQWPDGSNYVGYYNGPVVTWEEGNIVEVDVKVTAHHKGHYEFSICDQVITNTLSNPQACLDKHILERATSEEAGVTDCQPGDKRAACQPVDPRHKERFYLPPPGFSPTGANTHKFYLKLPAGFTCNACTMQWRWWTANSCIPSPDYACFKQDLETAGFSASSWGLGNSCLGGGCNRCGCGEEFRNCIDVSITASGEEFPASPTSAPTTSTTQSPTTTSVTTTTTSTTTPKPTMCEAVPIDGGTLGATSDKCSKACSIIPAGVWPCRTEGPCRCDTKNAPTQSPSLSPTVTISPTFRTHVPTSSGGSGECKANPDMITSRGVSDTYCAQCAEGYQWWPCNEAILCIGDACRAGR